MPGDPMSQRPRAYLSRSACLLVGSGCLLTAGHILSSVIPAPSNRGPSHSISGSSELSHPVIPISGMAGRHHPGLAISVTMQGTTLRITNASQTPWQSGRMQIGDWSSPQVPATIKPYQTVEVPLGSAYLITQNSKSYRRPLPLRWVCRTKSGVQAWNGLLIL